MKLEKFFSHRKIVGKILGYSLVGFVFAIIGIGMAYKFAKKPFYFYNSRADVVLTDSMSVKNEKYKDFLKDTKQIQAFDLVISERITSKTKLNVYDVVIFNNPDIGIDMHRIVEVDSVGDNFKFNNLETVKLGEYDAFRYVSPMSSIELKETYIYTDFEIVAYTTSPFDENEYYFNVGVESVKPTINSEFISTGYYKNTITYHRNSSSPAKFSITKQSYDFDSYFKSIRLYGGKGEILIDSEIVKRAVDGEYAFNVNERYLIRGDKANTDDGWYEKSQLQAKVVTVVPKMGYAMRFLSTPYGAIMIIGLMFIPIAYWIFFERKEKKESGENEKE